MGQHNAPAETFDYIVVGAGSAGAAVVNRLSADSSISVLLLEAGGKDRKQEIHIPAAFSTLFRSSYDWNYDTVPQPELGGRTIYWPRGKMPGGSSSLNAMMWVSGFAADYDRWAEAAGPTWSWSSLRPYFRQVQHLAAGTSAAASDGAVSIEAQRSPRAATASFLEAVRQTGLPVEEANTMQPAGFTQTMGSQRRGARFSAADAYLKPARRRKNPVGTLFDAERPAEVARYLLRRHGMLTSNVAEAYGFVRTRPELPLADIEILFAPVAYVGEGLVKPPGPASTTTATRSTTPSVPRGWAPTTSPWSTRSCGSAASTGCGWRTRR